MPAELEPYLTDLKNRNADALAGWVRDHHAPLFRFLRHLTRDFDVAEDLVQQTFLSALKGLPSFQGKSSMSTWMHSIAFREYVAWRRKHRITLPLAHLLPARDGQIDRVEKGEVLIVALHQLPSSMREAFLLHEVQGLTVSEIALVMGAPEGTVKSWLFHAREKLKVLLTGSHQEVSCGH